MPGRKEHHTAISTGSWRSWAKDTLLIGMLALALTTAACDLGPDGTTTSAASASSTGSVAVTPPPSVAHRDALFVQISPDVTGSYPRSLLRGFLQQMAGWLDGIPRVNSDGATIYVTLINSEPYAPSSTVLSFRSAPVPNDPVWSAPAPTPSCPNNPYACSDAQATVAANNMATSAAYQQQLAEVQNELASRQQAMQQQTAKLRQLQPAVDDRATSIWGVLNLAAQRFTGMSGDKWLILASDMGNNTTIDALPPDLTGIHVLVMDWYCTAAVSCQRTKTVWSAVFQRAHAASWAWLDPGASANTSSPWS